MKIFNCNKIHCPTTNLSKLDRCRIALIASSALVLIGSLVASGLLFPHIGTTSWSIATGGLILSVALLTMSVSAPRPLPVIEEASATSSSQSEEEVSESTSSTERTSSSSESTSSTPDPLLKSLVGNQIFKKNQRRLQQRKTMNHETADLLRSMLSETNPVEATHCKFVEAKENDSNSLYFRMEGQNDFLFQLTYLEADKILNPLKKMEKFCKKNRLTLISIPQVKPLFTEEKQGNMRLLRHGNLDDKTDTLADPFSSKHPQINTILEQFAFLLSKFGYFGDELSECFIVQKKRGQMKLVLNTISLSMRFAEPNVLRGLVGTDYSNEVGGLLKLLHEEAQYRIVQRKAAQHLKEDEIKTLATVVNSILQTKNTKEKTPRKNTLEFLKKLLISPESSFHLTKQPNLKLIVQDDCSCFFSVDGESDFIFQLTDLAAEEILTPLGKMEAFIQEKQLDHIYLPKVLSLSPKSEENSSCILIYPRGFDKNKVVPDPFLTTDPLTDEIVKQLTLLLCHFGYFEDDLTNCFVVIQEENGDWKIQLNPLHLSRHLEKPHILTGLIGSNPSEIKGLVELLHQEKHLQSLVNITNESLDLTNKISVQSAVELRKQDLQKKKRKTWRQTVGEKGNEYLARLQQLLNKTSNQSDSSSQQDSPAVSNKKLSRSASGGQSGQ